MIALLKKVWELRTILFWMPRILTFLFAFIIIIFSFLITDNCNPLLFGLLCWKEEIKYIVFIELCKILKQLNN